MRTPYDHDATVIRKDIVNERLCTITFKPTTRIGFLPGQYLSVVLPGKRPIPLSIASAPTQESIEFGVAVHGPGTTAIRDLPVGATATLRGPFGKFVLTDERRVCLLAGGVGITPLMSMLRSIRDAKMPVDTVLFYSARSKDEILWQNELARPSPHIKTLLMITREPDVESPYRPGRITATLIKAEVPDYAVRDYFLCGPQEFISSMMGALDSMGIAPARIRKESW